MDGQGCFRENIRFLRQRRKLTQYELSESLGISREKLKAIETGQTMNVSLNDALTFSRYFCVPIDVLISIKLSKAGEMKVRVIEADYKSLTNGNHAI